eukprot:6173016-Pleurochrysis_carterae.AAC.3
MSERGREQQVSRREAESGHARKQNMLTPTKATSRASAAAHSSSQRKAAFTSLRAGVKARITVAETWLMAVLCRQRKRIGVSLATAASKKKRPRRSAHKMRGKREVMRTPFQETTTCGAGSTSSHF